MAWLLERKTARLRLLFGALFFATAFLTGPTFAEDESAVVKEPKAYEKADGKEPEGKKGQQRRKPQECNTNPDSKLDC